jgi:hypothetical protein
MAGTTTNYGWTYPTSTDLVKDGATAIQTATQGVDTTLFTALGGAYPGLRLVKKQTIGTAVSSVQVTNAFSATYDNYRVVISGGLASGNNYGKFILGSATANYYSAGAGFTYAGVATGVAANNLADARYTWALTTGWLDLSLEIKNPFLTKNTLFNFTYTGFSGLASFAGAGYLSDNTSHTSFTISSFGSETLTGGTIYVYGYGIS